MIEKHLVLILVLVISLSYTPISKKETPIVDAITIHNPTNDTQDKATTIINEAIEAHGGDLYNKADYSFTFRKKEYRFTNSKDQFTYTVKTTNKGKQIEDFLINGRFERYINQEKIELSQKNSNKYAAALNSVIYFATLPFKLKDKAVNKKFIETIKVKDKSYDVIEITFDKEGGGKDHEDVFYYWIHQNDKSIDYLAYKYHVNGGGVRFRSAYNRRVIDGITFQDYVNWKASTDTSLKNLSALYEQNKLKELSKIKTENIINLRK